MNFMQITVLHDQVGQADFICRVLSTAQYGCDILRDAEQLVANLQVNNVDLLLVYWPALKGQGRKILRLVRENLSATLPIVFIASGVAEQDIFEGISAGTVDYLITPIRANELVSRIKACLALHYPGRTSIVKVDYGPFVFTPAKKQITVEGRSIPVSAKEFQIAEILMQNLGSPLSRTTLLEKIWGGTVSEASRTIDTHISRVRTKLKLIPENGYRLSTIYGYGYLLDRIRPHHDTDESAMNAL